MRLLRQAVVRLVAVHMTLGIGGRDLAKVLVKHSVRYRSVLLPMFLEYMHSYL